MNILETLLGSPRRVPSKTVVLRSYQSAKRSRFTTNYGASAGSADAELAADLPTLRNRSRALIRDSSYAKRAKVITINNVVGSGIGMQGQIKGANGKRLKRLNDAVEGLWLEWSAADQCHTGGKLCFADLERLVMGEIFEAGEVLLRKHRRPFGASRVPFALEVIEAERIADDYLNLPGVDPRKLNQGIEHDEYGRPVAYYLRRTHPGDLRLGALAGITSDQVERVPADEIIHLYTISRWPQSRGEPWLHTAIRKLHDMDAYSEAELDRARTQACVIGAIESPEQATSFGAEQEDGTVQMDLEVGTIHKLAPGEKLNALSPTAPNPALDPFMRYMLREVAVGLGVSYASLSGDYSQSNYSSSRLALLDDRDLWRVLQAWFIAQFRSVVHREWLAQAVLSRALPQLDAATYFADVQRFGAVRFKPRGWSWIDPQAEVEAYQAAIRSGFMTRTQVVAATGGGVDIEDVNEERRQELDDAAELGLQFDVDQPPEQVPVTDEPKPEPEQSDEEGDEARKRMRVVR